MTIYLESEINERDLDTASLIHGFCHPDLMKSPNFRGLTNEVEIVTKESLRQSGSILAFFVCANLTVYVDLHVR